MRGRPTIQMVADLAGVSRGTVDRVLNNRPHVNEAVRERVLDAMREIGYVPPARASHTARPPLVLGILLPNWEGQFQAEVEQGIRRACAQLEDSNVQVLRRRCGTDLPQERRALPSAPSATLPWRAGSPLGRRRASPASPLTPTCRRAADCALWARTSTPQAGWPPGCCINASPGRGPSWPPPET